MRREKQKPIKMKIIPLIALLFSSVFTVFGQSKKTIQILASFRIFEKAVYDKKDSASLELLLHKNFIFTDENGNTQSREQVIERIVSNKSIIQQVLTAEPYNVKEVGETFVGRRLFKIKEVNANNEEKLLSFWIELTFVKDKKLWKVISWKESKSKE